MTKDNPPKTVTILGKPFTVKVVTSPHYEAYGEVDCAAQEILIASEQAHEQRRDTLLHEISHAIEGQLGMTIDHSFIHALGCGLSQVIRDNPDLVKWLTKKGSK